MASRHLRLGCEPVSEPTELIRRNLTLHDSSKCEPHWLMIKQRRRLDHCRRILGMLPATVEAANGANGSGATWTQPGGGELPGGSESMEPAGSGARWTARRSRVRVGSSTSMEPAGSGATWAKAGRRARGSSESTALRCHRSFGPRRCRRVRLALTGLRRVPAPPRLPRDRDCFHRLN